MCQPQWVLINTQSYVGSVDIKNFKPLEGTVTDCKSSRKDCVTITGLVDDSMTDKLFSHIRG